MLANLITISRMPLLALIIYLLYQPSPTGRLVAAVLTLVLIAMDMVDGFVARSRNESSLLGSVLDIAADRSVEFVFWVVFAHLRLISVLVPLIVLVRGVFVDSLRSVAPSKGLKPFELMRSSLGRFLVGSPWLRTPYAFVKAAAFFLLALQHAFTASNHPLLPIVSVAAQITTWLAVAFCLVRGLPVLIEAPPILMEESDSEAAA